MNYELAKKLKDAGFPQHDGEMHAILFDKNDTDPRKLSVHKPDLGELIRECGEKFNFVCRNPKDGLFGAELLGAYDSDVTSGHSTPEEAVAELWLTLHTK